jgi:uncharacterized protein YkwD
MNMKRRQSPPRGWVLLAFAALACSEPGGAPSEGSNSNWLSACESDAQCGAAAACRCGGCTRECSSDAACSGLENARCVDVAESARATQCRNEHSASFGICLPRCEPGSCREGQACVAGSCVLSALPASPFCLAVANEEPAARTREDELLQALNETRAAGGVSCAGDPPSAPAPALRLDARLVCAARVFASDLRTTRSQSLTDSQGRGSEQRMNAAGYSDNQWAESFAFESGSASLALNVMLGDAGSCPRLVDPSYLDVGVAYVGDVNVVSLASE